MKYLITRKSGRWGLCISFAAKDDEHAMQQVRNDKFFASIRGDGEIELFRDFNRETLEWETKLNFNL